MRACLLALLLSLPAHAQQDTGPPVGGIGRLACRQVIGAENAPYLAEVAGWALGYLAGRLDAGQRVREDAALSPADAIDAAAGIALRCREAPDGPVIDAVRNYAEGIFSEPAQGGTVRADAPSGPSSGGDTPGDTPPVPRPE